MIKFLCVSCGERLSVPDQNAGRKGVCPTCKAINRIPLKGFPETQPNAPTIARSAGKPTSPATRPVPAFPPSEYLKTEPRPPVQPVAAPATFDPVAITRPQPSAEPFHNSAAIFGGPGPLSREAAAFAEESENCEIYVQRRLPAWLKMTLLILAALVIVGALYFALYSALHAFVRASS